jgi:hypothetical protein
MLAVMVDVTVTLTIQGRDVPIAKIPDKSVAAALQKMGREVARKLQGVHCAEHAKGPTNVRVRVDPSGNADLQYEACCQALTDAIGRAMG